MLAHKLPQPMSSADFFAFLDTRPEGERWELIDGQPVLMASPMIRHAICAANIAEALAQPARAKGCRVLRDLYLRVAANDGHAFDPDVMVRCGPMGDLSSRIVEDATIVFEVLCPSTMGYDRGVKIEAYLQHATLRQAVLVYPGEVRVESWARPEGAAWPEEPLVLRTLKERLPVPALEAELPMAAIYDGLDLA